MKTCLRCHNLADIDEIGAKLSHFVCATCRIDRSEWSFKEPQEIRDTGPKDPI